MEKKEMHILHPEDISAYLKEAERRGVLAMFFLELTTGLRKSELVALLWSDLDEQSMTLNVCKQAVGSQRRRSEGHEAENRDLHPQNLAVAGDDRH